MASRRSSTNGCSVTSTPSARSTRPRAGTSTPCASASRASARERCATRSPSTSATPSPITRPFRPTDDEHALYEAVSGFLQREDSYALPKRQRHLTALILRKLLASSSTAIAVTLDTLRGRLETLRDERTESDPEFAERLIEDEEIEEDLLDEIVGADDAPDTAEQTLDPIDRQKVREEIDALRRLADWARRIGVDTKSQTLLKALEIGFEQMARRVPRAGRSSSPSRGARRTTSSRISSPTATRALGNLESGVDFEKRILAVYQECRTLEEIDAAFRALQTEMDEQIRSRLDDTRRTLLEHFDEDVHQRLRLQLADAQAQLDRVGRRFWSLTFSGFEDDGAALDPETMEKLFLCAGRRARR